jgi:hypothetical protein
MDEPEAQVAQEKTQEAKIATAWSKGAEGWSLTTAAPASSKPLPVWAKQPSDAEPRWIFTAAAEPPPWGVGYLLDMASDFVEVLSGENKSPRWAKGAAGWNLATATPAPSKPRSVAWTKQRTDAADSEWSLQPTAPEAPAPTLKWAKQDGNWVMIRTIG